MSIVDHINKDLLSRGTYVPQTFIKNFCHT